MAAFDLSAWPRERIERECARAYRRYHGLLRERHIEFFRQHPEQRDLRRNFCARSFADALPTAWGGRLEKLIPYEKRHRWCESGGSSQALALGLLGPAALWGHDLEWLFVPRGPLLSVGRPIAWQFEYEVGFGLLNERPHTTDIDFFASGPHGVVALEAKYTETGWGQCRCKRRDEGRCDDRVLNDRPYWGVARDVFGLNRPHPPLHCQLSLTPWKAEVAAGKPFQGPACSFLCSALKNAQASRDDFWITNAFKSRPYKANGAKREPSNEELEEHGRYLEAELRRKQPRVILLLGKRASAMFGFLPRPEYILIRAQHPSSVRMGTQEDKQAFQEAVDRFVKLARTI